jgi:hypothetical protein
MIYVRNFPDGSRYILSRGNWSPGAIRTKEETQHRLLQAGVKIEHIRNGFEALRSGRDLLSNPVSWICFTYASLE